MKNFLFLLLLTSCLQGCAQNTKPATIANKPAHNDIKAGGSCEGCEAIYESPVPFEQLNEVDTLPDFNDNGPKLEVSGFVYKRDGKTPAPGVVLYVYHTDQKGIYPTKGDEKVWAKRHGYIRGWIKTNKDGFYKFYTLVPASYPNSRNPKHIHPTIKEPGVSEYYIDEMVFDDDPLLPDSERNRKNPRGASGVLKTQMKDGMLRALHNIVLGLNIPNYPVSISPAPNSGLAVGSNCPAFDPVHLSGADKGKDTCPMCKYGYGQGVMVWFNHTDLSQMKSFLRRMDTEIKNRGEKKLRVFMMYMNPMYKENSEQQAIKKIQSKLREWCEAEKLTKVAMTWIPSPVDEETAGLYKINPEVKNTFLVYKGRRVIQNWVNKEYNDETADAILKSLGEKI